MRFCVIKNDCDYFGEWYFLICSRPSSSHLSPIPIPGISMSVNFQSLKGKVLIHTLDMMQENPTVPGECAWHLSFSAIRTSQFRLMLFIFLPSITAYSCFLPKPAIWATFWVEGLLPFNVTDFRLGELSAILSC